MGFEVVGYEVKGGRLWGVGFVVGLGLYITGGMTCNHKPKTSDLGPFSIAQR